MIKTITPKFPDQESINNYLYQLSPEEKEKYEELKEKYKAEIAAEHPNHEKIKKLISEIPT